MALWSSSSKSWRKIKPMNTQIQFEIDVGDFCDFADSKCRIKRPLVSRWQFTKQTINVDVVSGATAERGKELRNEIAKANTVLITFSEDKWQNKTWLNFRHLGRCCLASLLKGCAHFLWLVEWLILMAYPYLPNPSVRAGYDTRSIFKRSLTGLNSELSFF